MPTVALLHTVAGLPAVFDPLCAELLPDAERFHMVDESLLKTTIRDGSLSPLTARRVLGHVASAELAGADAVLVTCSSIGAAAELARATVSIPVIRVDEAMAAEAVSLGGRIGVVATLPTTLAPTADLVRRTADRAGTRVEVVSRVCDGAFAALGRGEAEEHDRLVREGIEALLPMVDVLVLAQASMARIVAAMPEDAVTVPVLSSPRSGVRRLAETVFV